MGIVEAVLAGLAALGAVVAGYFKMSRDKERILRDGAERRAKHNAAAAEAQAKAARDLKDEIDRQAAERQPPNVEQRDDLEGTW